MEYGKLIVNVLTGGGTLAVEDAAITVFERKTNDISIVADVFSGSDGASPEISLEAPPREDSLNEGLSDKPFSLYIIQVIKDGYYSVTGNGVAIFSGITSIQQINLIPKASGGLELPISGITYDETPNYDL
ncbi:MAG: hypothetical protein PUB34_06720 [Clostridia bacterium]|nr:hypothetical protein [Clostridia bacterium]